MTLLLTTSIVYLRYLQEKLTTVSPVIGGAFSYLENSLIVNPSIPVDTQVNEGPLHFHHVTLNLI